MIHTIPAIVAGVITTSTITIERIQWTGNIANGQTAIVQDNQGRIIFQGNASQVNDKIEQYYKSPTPFYGINVTQLDSGTLLFYYR